MVFVENVIADWSRHFDEPLSLPDGRELRTLLDAVRYIDALPEAKQKRPEWQTATKLVLMAAEGRGSLMFANLALIRVLGAWQKKHHSVKIRLDSKNCGKPVLTL
jgi:hypothetical protein